MNLLFWGLTVSTIGKVMLATGVLIAHSELAHEKRVDALVIESFKVERVLTVLGILFIVGGYFMEIFFYEFTTTLLTCHGDECTTAAAVILSQ
jgi:hypothetical protein